MRVIFNPMAAGGRSRRVQADLEAHLSRAAAEANVTLEWVVTLAPGHATTLAAEAARAGCEMVVAAGGDGTVNEVLNGLMQAGDQGHRPALGIVPVGSGNDFAWLAGIPADPIAACQRLLHGRTRTVDVGHIREADGRARYFDNGCGIGFDAVVSLEARRLKWLRGFLIYLVAVLKTLILHHHAPALRLRFDGRELTCPTMMLTIGNGQRHGGLFFVTPDAELDDGLLDLCIAGQLSRLGMLLVIPRFMRGTHGTHPQVQMARARRVSVDAPVPMAIHLDGEIFATDARRFEVSVLPGALRVCV